MHGLAKLYLLLGFLWMLAFIGIWIWRRRENIDWRSPFEYGILTVLIISTWLCWPYSLVYNLPYLWKKGE